MRIRVPEFTDKLFLRNLIKSLFKISVNAEMLNEAKDEAIALLLEKGIITPTDLLQPKDETKKATQVACNTDPSKYAHLKI